MDDIDVYRSAKVLIDQHGARDAEIHAAQRVDEMLAAGDLDGSRTWLRIVSAISELTAAERPAGTPTH